MYLQVQQFHLTLERHESPLSFIFILYAYRRSPQRMRTGTWVLGITFGGIGDDSARFEGRMQAHIDLKGPAGAALEASADSTWCERNVYGTIFTYARGAVASIKPRR